MTSETATDASFDVDQIRHGLQTDGIIALKGAFTPGVGGAGPRGHRRRVRGGQIARGRRGGARPEPLVRRDPPGGAARLRRAGRSSLGSHGVRDDPGPRLPDRGGRLRHAIPRCHAAAVASRLSEPSGDHGRWPAHLPGVQPDDRGHDRRDGAVRDRAGDAVGSRRRLRPRAVSSRNGVRPLRGAGPAQVPEGGRHLCPVGLDRPPRDAEPVGGAPTGARPRCRRAGCRQ